MKLSSRSVLAVVGVPIILAGSAQAGFLGVTVVAKEAPGTGLIVCNVYAVFDRPNDEFIAVAGTFEGQALSIEVVGGQFYQDAQGSVLTAPFLQFLPGTSGKLAYDTFVTIGTKVDDLFSTLDNVSTTPGFGFAVGTNQTGNPNLNNGPLQTNSGSWFILPSGPGNGGLGAPNANGQVLLFQGSFEIASGATGIQGTMLLRFTSNGVPATQGYVSFSHLIGPAQPSGCCFSDGSCVLLLQDDCISAGGNHIGTACEPNLCPQPSCPADINGDDLVDVIDLLDLLANWHACPPPQAACCLPDGSCVEAARETCALLGGDYQGLETSCDPTGACCFIDGSCIVTVADCCADAGGAYQGDGTVCQPNDCPQPLGSCCFIDGSCQLLTEDECISAGADYAGDFTACKPNLCPQRPGACCFCDGSCNVLTEEVCIAMGGGFAGDFTDCSTKCPTVGACCLPQGFCLLLSPVLCGLNGGTYHGTCSTCDQCP